jgi:hypothetical protein
VAYTKTIKVVKNTVNKKAILFLVCLLMLWFIGLVDAQPMIKLNKYLRPAQQDSIAELYSKNISQENISKNLHVLASDEYEGRETSKKGQKMAAKYIAEQFKNAGIPPYKDTTYYQEFKLNVILPMPAEVFVSGKHFKNNKDFYTYPEQAEKYVETENIQFLGYGIQDKNYDDYGLTDVKNKVVMILSGEPMTKDSMSFITHKKEKSPWATYYRTKLEIAKDNGVKALLIVSDNIEIDLKKNKHRLESASIKLELEGDEPFVMYISQKMANRAKKKKIQLKS